MGLLDSNAPQWLPIDSISGNRKIIEPEHAAIHAGLNFTVSVLTTTSSYLSLVFTTPAASTKKRLHFVFSANTDKAATIRFYEGAVVSGGSALTQINNNRESALTDGTVWVKDAVVTSTGTILESHLIGSTGSGNVRPGGGGVARNEWYLKYATVYMIRVECDVATTKAEITVPYYYRAEA
jgi:hypothetical protein